MCNPATGKCICDHGYAGVDCASSAPSHTVYSQAKRLATRSAVVEPSDYVAVELPGGRRPKAEGAPKLDARRAIEEEDEPASAECSRHGFFTNGMCYCRQVGHALGVWGEAVARGASVRPWFARGAERWGGL